MCGKVSVHYLHCVLSDRNIFIMLFLLICISCINKIIRKISVTKTFCDIWWKLMKHIDIVTFFYLYRRKFWFGQNFWLLVFDKFTRFGTSWSLFDYFWKMSVCLDVCLCVCDKNFEASVARQLMHGISWNFIFWIILP